MLGGEIVALGFTLLTHEGGLLGILVHVVGNGAHVVEEFRVDRPLAVFVPD